jgi:hypothetical protein
VRNFINYFSWIGIYYFIPLIPFFLGGIISFKLQINLDSHKFPADINTFLDSFNYPQLVFSIGLINVFTAQSIQNFKPIINSDPDDRSPLAFVRLGYIISFSFWGLIYFCDKLTQFPKFAELSIIFLFLKYISVLLYIYCTICVFLIQSFYKFKI